MATDFSTSRIKAKHRQENADWFASWVDLTIGKGIFLPNKSDELEILHDKYIEAETIAIEADKLIWCYVNSKYSSNPRVESPIYQSLAKYLARYRYRMNPSTLDKPKPKPITYGNIDFCGCFDSTTGSMPTHTLKVIERLSSISKNTRTAFCFVHMAKQRLAVECRNKAFDKVKDKYKHFNPKACEYLSLVESKEMSEEWKDTFLIGLSFGLHTDNAVFPEKPDLYYNTATKTWMVRSRIKTDPELPFDLDEFWSAMQEYA